MKVSKSSFRFSFSEGTKIEYFPEVQLKGQLQQIPSSEYGFQTEYFHKRIIFLIYDWKFPKISKYSV